GRRRVLRVPPPRLRRQVPTPYGVRRYSEDQHRETAKVQAARGGEGGVKPPASFPATGRHLHGWEQNTLAPLRGGRHVLLLKRLSAALPAGERHWRYDGSRCRPRLENCAS